MFFEDVLEYVLEGLGRVLLFIPMATGLTISFIISLPIIPIIFIIDLVFEILLKVFRSENKLEYYLEKELKSFREKSLPDFKSLEDDNNQNSYQTTERILYGYQKLDKDTFARFLKAVILPEEESGFSNIFGRSSIIPKIFLVLLHKALAVIGLTYPRSLRTRCDIYKVDISNAFNSLKFKVLLLSSRPKMEEYVATLLSKIIYEKIVLISSSSDIDYLRLGFVDRFYLLSEETNSIPDCFVERNKCIVKNIKIMVDLLSSNQLGIDDASADEKFNKCFRELMAARLFMDPADLEDWTILPKLADNETRSVQQAVLNFFAKNNNNIPDNLHGKDKKDYILKCCEKMLEFGIEGGQLANPPKNGFLDPSNKIALSPPKSYAKNAQLLADALAKSIVKGLNSNSLHNVYDLASKNPDSDRCQLIYNLLRQSFSRVRVVLGLGDVLQAIDSIVYNYAVSNHLKNKEDKGSLTAVHRNDDPNKVEEVTHQASYNSPSSTLELESSSQNKCHNEFNR